MTGDLDADVAEVLRVGGMRMASVAVRDGAPSARWAHAGRCRGAPPRRVAPPSGKVDQAAGVVPPGWRLPFTVSVYGAYWLTCSVGSS
jgi:hypothetical protein